MRRLQGRIYDVAIIGGGISGAAVARDAAGRGLSVYLCEAGDLGAGASSASEKIVHGRLRALEGLNVRAMRSAVAEREILLRAAPHAVRPVRICIPHHGRMARPSLLRLGLFLFDRATHNTLPKSGRVDLHPDATFPELKPHFELAFATSDCIADDSRLVVLNALDARDRGASINPRTRCVMAEREREHWRLSVEGPAHGDSQTVLARILVNAAGAEAGEVVNHVVQSGAPIDLRLTRLVSIAIRRPHDGRTAYALLDGEGRFVHVLPFRPGIMIVGCALGDHVGPPGIAEAGDADLLYLADVVGQYFHQPLSRSAIVATHVGVRALPVGIAPAPDGHAAVDAPPGSAPLINLYAGDLTGHRRLAELAVDRMGRFIDVSPAWTETATLPGGRFPADGMVDLIRALRAAYPFVAENHARRLVETYGTRASTILTGARRAEDLGARFGDDLTEAEVRFLHEEEWAETAEDVLWRRSRLGFTMPAGEIQRLETLMATLAVGRGQRLAPAS